MTYKKKLIEVALPLDVINRESAREKSIRHGHPSTLHLWWARRPLAAARAVIWASLVDDPSAHPDQFPTDEDQERERKRLFMILEELVKWENSNNERILSAARAEIMKSTDGNPPPILDPFCGGGTIPLEAQRLGLKALGGDLNPVAVLISKAMVEIPPRFAGLPPVNPVARAGNGLQTWERAQGLAEDIRYYGQWMRDRAWERIGHLYPTVKLPPEQGGGEATVIAWIWARTVKCPNPAWDGHVPLVKSWILSNKKGKATVWVESQVDPGSQTVSYRVREGGEPPAGTIGRGGGRCLATGTPIGFDYIRQEGRSGRLGAHLLAIVAEGDRKRVYVTPDPTHSELAEKAPTTIETLGPLPDKGLGFRVQNYGITDWAQAFSTRQLAAAEVFGELIPEMRGQVIEDAERALGQADERPLRERGRGPAAYGEALATYLSFVLDRCVSRWCSLTAWNVPGEKIEHLFRLQTVSMVWDYPEANPFSNSTGNWTGQVDWVAKCIDGFPANGAANIDQRDARSLVALGPTAMISTDPPYYDNVGYADLSDFFYVWMRRSLRSIWPDELSTLVTPKSEELIADPGRHGTPQEAYRHFEKGMAEVFAEVAGHHDPGYPVTVFYAFKQAENTAEGRVSTGWETFLQGLLDSGLSVNATWPVRTEMPGGVRNLGRGALASSIVLACRLRKAIGPMATRSEFLGALQAELPKAVRLLQAESILPVDLAQSAIGPGMAVFSRYSRVVEADGQPMTVRQALALINEVLQEVLSEEETEFDADTRWALTWYEENGFTPGPYGRAETLSKAKDTSVAGVINAGVAVRNGDKVSLRGPADLSDDWDPTVDRRPTVWELTHHLIRRLESSETEAADLLRKVGGGYGDRARQLAYLLFDIAERKGRAKEAVAYNGLIQGWPDLTRQATASAGPFQQTLVE